MDSTQRPSSSRATVSLAYGSENGHLKTSLNRTSRKSEKPLPPKSSRFRNDSGHADAAGSLVDACQTAEAALGRDKDSQFAGLVDFARRRMAQIRPLASHDARIADSSTPAKKNRVIACRFLTPPICPIIETIRRTIAPPPHRGSHRTLAEKAAGFVTAKSPLELSRQQAGGSVFLSGRCSDGRPAGSRHEVKSHLALRP